MVTPGVGKGLLARALAYPGASDHDFWGETVVKVGGKVKPRSSAGVALAFPFAEPTGFGPGNESAPGRKRS